MAGFSISLKNKVAKKAGPRKNAFAPEAAEKTRTQIDGFSRLGAMQGLKSVAENTTLVIAPVNPSSSLPKTTSKAGDARKGEDEAALETTSAAESEVGTHDLEERAKQSLLSNVDTGSMVINSHKESKDVPQADYEAVPVEQFGAALLRGMGWDGRLDKTETKAPRRKLGAVLGIGAKPLDKDLEPELTKKNISAPLKRRHEPVSSETGSGGT